MISNTYFGTLSDEHVALCARTCCSKEVQFSELKSRSFESYASDQRQKRHLTVFDVLLILIEFCSLLIRVDGIEP